MKKDNVNNSVKALKKQLGAAVAMVCVAAVALGSSTYAWFVSNNTVKATTVNISAQSNAPFLKIDSATVTAGSGTTKTLTEPTGENKLYPSQVVGTIANGTAAKFESAYASAKDSAAELANSRFTVGTNGTADEAVTGKYAIKQTFYIGTSDANAGSFKDLKVSAVQINATAGSKLEDAMRVLVVGENGWVVWKKGTTETDGWVKTYTSTETDPQTINGQGVAKDNSDSVIDSAIAAAASGKVDVYVFYDGADDDVKTSQLADLTGCGVTITFTATPVNTDENVVGADNNYVEEPATAAGN